MIRRNFQDLLGGESPSGSQISNNNLLPRKLICLMFVQLVIFYEGAIINLNLYGRWFFVCPLVSHVEHCGDGPKWNSSGFAGQGHSQNIYTPENKRLETINHPIEKENHLNQTSIFWG